MVIQRWTLLGFLAVAGLAWWLLVAGPTVLLGLDTGNVACGFDYAAKVVHYERDRR